MEPHAVRWTINVTDIMYLQKYTKWHLAGTGWTACGLSIPIGGKGGRFLPETDEIDAVDCKKCLRKMDRGSMGEK